MEKVIFHIDVNSAFLSWEAVYRLKTLGGSKDLREVPSAIAGDKQVRHGIILAKSLPAKKFHIQTGEMVGTALKKCPDLLLIPPHYDLYEHASRAFIEVLQDFSPCVEQYSVDEAFCDMTGTVELYGPPMVTANLIKDTIYKNLGFTVNVGVSSNKMLAKMAGDFKKPNLAHSLFPNELKAKMWHLPVSELFFVGRATTKKLFSLGIHTIGELAATDPAILRSHLKTQGEIIWAFANGYDFSSVVSEAPRQKGYGNSITIAFDITDKEVAYQVFLSLSETVAARLRADKLEISVVAISLVDCDFNRYSHQCNLNSTTNITEEIWRAACKLFNQLWSGVPLRNLGIHTSKVTESMGLRQMNLFDLNMNYERMHKLDVAIDSIRDSYGDDAIFRASFLNSSLYHMAGGISKEKRFANYEGVTIE
ncbi:Y-family DNA polymerase [Anaerocolumna chitinilytica]|uniref:DNA polymerase IV n=1 Tax=Anaerocolumna chitinilytica TaxID=1727145 RepID=A0A7I8DIM5_9FIRM|nr:DNA polymerase IV [Anaerocolumna chitinilytica]BCJ98289.1 DNA polymerase IV [Anaerocolumna chitinilytica]